MPLSAKFFPLRSDAAAYAAQFIAAGFSAVILAATDLHERAGFVCQVYGDQD